MPIGNLTAFLTYILQILLSVMMAVMVAILLPRAAASAERVEQVLDTVPVVADPEHPINPTLRSGLVSFEHVTFSYPGSERPVLEDLTFTLEPGQTSAIIGGTGSGKTTLLNLIPRFFDATSGAIVVNGVDVRDQRQETLWASIDWYHRRPTSSRAPLVPTCASVVLTRPTSNSGGRWRSPRPATSSRPCRACSRHRSTRAAPTSRGASASDSRSPGTRQGAECLPLRRLLLGPRRRHRRAPTRRLEVRNPRRLGRHRGQRVSTIMHAERIIVLDDGRVVGMGSHNELLENCEPYHEIVVSQLGEDAAI